MFAASYRLTNKNAIQSESMSSSDNNLDDMYSFDKKTYDTYARSGTAMSGYGVPTARMNTATASGGRPVTSARAAGYSSRGRTGAIQTFDPFNQAGRATPDKQEIPPEDVIKQLERKVNFLIEESTIAQSEGNLELALEKAKEAGKKERQLSKQREQFNMGEQLNLDLTYCVLFNLANQYHANRMYQEALNSYAVIVKNKLFNQAGRLRVNMGNIYFEQQKYSQAIKMYRMALDQIPNTNRDFRLKIMRNIGNAFVKMGQYADAITSFEANMEGNPDFHTGFNLILCYYAMGDKDRMKKAFQRLVAVPPPKVEQAEDFGPSSKSDPIEDHEVFDEDSLRAVARERRQQAHHYILLSAKLIAPVVEASFALGYDWVVEALKNSSNSDMASELEIAKSIHYLKKKDFGQAIECLKQFEKKEPKLVGTAATNLSFLYFLEGEHKLAEQYAEVAIEHDRYNSKAQTNRGNTYFVLEKYKQAREHYQEAIGVDASCTEAMYNLGLVNKRLEYYTEALMWFEKLHSILRSNAEVIFQIADIYDKQGNIEAALEWYNILLSVVPTDPSVLCRLGEIFDREGDKSQAFQYFSESYRYHPSNMTVISWLGAYYVDCEVYEQAIQFFERASIIQPSQIKWQLMVASCYRRCGNYQQAYDTYKRMHEKYPEDVECLRFLVKIANELGLKEANDYNNKLQRIEKSGVKSGSNSARNSTGELEPSVQSNAEIRQLARTVEKRMEEVKFEEDVTGLLPE